MRERKREREGVRERKREREKERKREREKERKREREKESNGGSALPDTAWCLDEEGC